jgi:hypothetical protein
LLNDDNNYTFIDPLVVITKLDKKCTEMEVIALAEAHGNLLGFYT